MSIFGFFKATEEEVAERFNAWHSDNSDNESQDDFYNDDDDNYQADDDTGDEPENVIAVCKKVRTWSKMEKELKVKRWEQHIQKI